MTKEVLLDARLAHVEAGEGRHRERGTGRAEGRQC